MSSKRPLGSILGRFWKVLGGFWEGLGRNWGGFWKDLGTFAQVVGRLWTYLETCGPAGAESLNGTPALIREASQCAGVPPQRDKTGPLGYVNSFLDSK